jgi:hypothetical protein
LNNTAGPSYFYGANYAALLIAELGTYMLHIYNKNHILGSSFSVKRHMQAVVTMYNYQQFRHIGAPGWQLGWTWAKKEVIWSMVGAQTTEQGDCSHFKGNIPHSCKKDPVVIDLLPSTPYDMQIANCCKAGVISTFNQDPANAASSFQLSVGLAGTTTKTVKVPRNFTLRAPDPGYTCGSAIVGKPSFLFSADGRRAFRALSKLPI